MKIGIMTFWWAEDNYGQILQCYALQKYLREAGHNSYIIRYDPRDDYLKTPLLIKVLKAFNPFILIKYILFIFNKPKIERLNKKRLFHEFRNIYIKQSNKIYYSYLELKQQPPEADLYIVGSDQVWNTFKLPINRVINRINAYLLNFGDISIKRYSYAASFGKDKLDEKSKKIFASLLKEFNYISVREKSGIKICNDCGIENVDFVPDPTILLDTDIYSSLYKDINIKKLEKKYCFLYILGNKINYSIQSIYEWAKDMNIEVMYITGNSKNDKFNKIYVTIPEWIYYLEHSEYIITNSYHCSIFSLLYKKKFGIIKLAGKDESMNCRFDTLFELFKIKERYINNDFNNLYDEICWEEIDKIFYELKINCKLKNII